MRRNKQRALPSEVEPRDSICGTDNLGVYDWPECFADVTGLYHHQSGANVQKAVKQTYAT